MTYTHIKQSKQSIFNHILKFQRKYQKPFLNFQEQKHARLKNHINTSLKFHRLSLDHSRWWSNLREPATGLLLSFKPHNPLESTLIVLYQEINFLEHNHRDHHQNTYTNTYMQMEFEKYTENRNYREQYL